MTDRNEETEVKLYINNITVVKEHLRALGAYLISPRTHELNFRFDTPGKDFIREGRVLRLRQDDAVRLTYKDGTQQKDGVLIRREIEFTVSDFDSAEQFIEALGFEIVFIYEKYRTTYSLQNISTHPKKDLQTRETRIMIDELPYGNFIEIEGEFDKLKPLGKRLGLNWDAAIPTSYHALFDYVCKSRNLSFRDLSFEKFKGIYISPADLGVVPTDL